MSATSGKGERSFQINIEALYDELSLAYQWGRPSLLLAVNRSSIGQEKARHALQQKLEAAEHPVVPVTINESNPDVAVTLLQSEQPAEPVFFVNGLDRGGGEDNKEAFRALNLSRELFVEHELKVVFWLTPSEAASLSRLAPDFWSFRHRVIEFSSPAPRLPAEALARLLLWPGGDLPASPAALDETIRSLEATLAALPKTPESLILRIETWYNLGHARWAAGDPENAFKSLVAGMGLAQDRGFARLNTWLLTGTAILRHGTGRQQEASEIFQDLTQHDPEDGLLMMNAAVGLCSLGKNSEGLRQGARAVLREPGSPRLWNVMGHLQLALGKFDEAVDCFQRAAELAPAAAFYRESLAACYHRMELPAEALQQVEAARPLEDTAYDRAQIFSEAVTDNSAEAIRLLAAAVSAGALSRAAIQHDPNLNIILDSALIEQGV